MAWDLGRPREDVCRLPRPNQQPPPPPTAVPYCLRRPNQNPGCPYLITSCLQPPTSCLLPPKHANNTAHYSNRCFCLLQIAIPKGIGLSCLKNEDRTSVCARCLVPQIPRSLVKRLTAQGKRLDGKMVILQSASILYSRDGRPALYLCLLNIQNSGEPHSGRVPQPLAPDRQVIHLCLQHSSGGPA